MIFFNITQVFTLKKVTQNSDETETPDTSLVQESNNKIQVTEKEIDCKSAEASDTETELKDWVVSLKEKRSQRNC